VHGLVDILWSVCGEDDQALVSLKCGQQLGCARTPHAVAALQQTLALVKEQNSVAQPRLSQQELHPLHI
jgi:hypothetical protein